MDGQRERGPADCPVGQTWPEAMASAPGGTARPGAPQGGPTSHPSSGRGLPGSLQSPGREGPSAICAPSLARFSPRPPRAQPHRGQQQTSDRLAGSWDPAPHKAVAVDASSRGRGTQEPRPALRQRPRPPRPGRACRGPSEAHLLPRTPLAGYPTPGSPAGAGSPSPAAPWPPSPPGQCRLQPPSWPAAAGLPSSTVASGHGGAQRRVRACLPHTGGRGAGLGWAGLARADSSGNSTTSRPRRGLRAP